MKLSVAMFTYNHEAYVAQALDSALVQRAPFPFEIVIGDDGSTDGTPGILASYGQKHPDRVRPLLHGRRIGVGSNVYEVLTACRGEYVALLDGDDWWLSPDKLRRQVELLDAHPQHTLCFHPVRMFEQETRTFCGVWGESAAPLRSFTLDDFFAGRFYPRTSSIVYRAGAFEVPRWIPSVLNCDYVLITLAGDRGLFADLGPEAMSVYRLHARGVWSKTDSLEQLSQTVNTRRWLNRHFSSKYASALRVRAQLLDLARAQLEAGNVAAARNALREATLARGEGPLPLRAWAAAWLAVHLPRVARPLRSIWHTVRSGSARGA